MKSLIDDVISLFHKMPTGLIDSRALEKLEREKVELVEMISIKDEIGAILEAADCSYYAIKARVNGLISANREIKEIRQVADSIGLLPDDILRACIVKYSLRARPGNPKDDAAERMAIELLFPKEESQ